MRFLCDTIYDVPPEESLAGNWFDEATGETMTMEFPEGYLSIHSTIEDLLTHPEADPTIAEMQTMMGRPLPAGMSKAEIVARAKAGMQAIKFLTVEKMIPADRGQN